MSSWGWREGFAQWGDEVARSSGEALELYGMLGRMQKG